jgi:hypothetical protein
MLYAEIYRAQADMILEFMETNGIKREALDIIVGLPAWSPTSAMQAAAQHKAKVYKLYTDGLKQQDIARITGRSQSGIAMMLQRGRQKGEVGKRTYDARHAIQPTEGE